MTASEETFHGLNIVLEDHRQSLSKCCYTVDRCLEANRDNLRGFFEQCFSLLLKQIFGYEGSSWLNTISKNGQDSDAKSLVGLLAPNGHLLRAIHTADLDTLIKFEFPLTRLPTHTQQLIRIEAGRKVLEVLPQYHKHIIVDRQGNYRVHLNVFEYFVFWTAFYVLKSNQSTEPRIQHEPRGFGTLTPSLGTAFGGLKEHGSGLRHPYLKLLKLYLEHFLPHSQSNRSQTPIRGFGSPIRQRSNLAASTNRGSVLLNVLIEFWLTDGDEPLPLGPSRQGSQDLISGLKESTSLRIRTYQPPSDDLIGGLLVLCHHIVAVDEGRDSIPKPALTHPWLPEIPFEANSGSKTSAISRGPSRLGEHASIPAQVFAKRLYRFLWRAFKFWPEQQSLTAIVDLWLAYAMPWINPHFLEPASPSNAKSQTLQNLSHTLRRQPEQTSTSGRQEIHASAGGWENHVLANFAFYSQLLPMFIDLLRSRVSTRGDSALRQFIKVMHALKLSSEVTSLLRTVETDLSRYQSHPGRRPDGFYADLLPFIAEQKQHWENFASAGPTTSDLQELKAEVQLFSMDDRSLAANVRDLLNAGAGAAKENLLLESKSLAESVLPMDQLPPVHGNNTSHHGTTFSPVQGLRKAKWSDMQYKGDWMQRPLSSSEIGWLVRLLVLLSDKINSKLGFGQPLAPDEALKQPDMDIQDLQGFFFWLRKKGFRINLRPLGEKQTLAWIPICYLACWCVYRFIALILYAVQLD